MSNRLIHETSPYLLQHAHNPVDWYPWGEEALRRAQEEDRPLLVSIGYSSCHWCHVMERESFENEEIARVMNEHLVSVKVDREERPDLDSIYMEAVQAMTGRGGWPLNVFLTPDGKPFYAGTYFPPNDHHGMPGWPRVVMAVARAYREQKQQVVGTAEELTRRMRQASGPRASSEPLTVDLLRQASTTLASQHDAQHGGLGGAPKFPQPMTWEFLLRYHHRTGSDQALQMVERTLYRMAHGGIRDHLGGGFHRYSVDQVWLVPHFEKMLYDNALLARLYLHGYQVTGRPLYRQVAEETLDYLLRDMAHPQGGLYSAQDADSEGMEGKYYVWTIPEVEEALGREDARVFTACYGMTPQGNFEGKNILYPSLEGPPEQVARELGMSPEELDEVVRRCRERLLVVRERRVPPGLDDKVLTGWNGLALRSLAEAAAILARPDYRRAAEHTASFLLERLRDDGGRLLRSFRDGQARLKGYLEDYAALADGLLALHEATLDLRWLEEARSLADDMIALFWDDGHGVLYDTGSDHEALVVRPRDFFDNALPSGGALAADVLLRLGVLTGDEGYTRRAVSSLRSVRDLLDRAPAGFGHWLGALDFYLSTPREVVIVGEGDKDDTERLKRAVFDRFLPNKVVTGASPDRSDSADGWPLLEGRVAADGQATAYVCENYTCRAPVTEPEALAQQLAL